METGATLTVELDGDECELLVELLEAECRRLPVEIHHSHHGEFKQLLKRRLSLAENLLSRLQLRAETAA